ncbi:MAG: hypothetical protein NTV82_02820, partial [Candidatus Aminicenantes bacterium]|nr:hypothetical protein [Candidatus Aminicenantes bacterium]
MMAEGKSQREAAVFFGVSDAAISKKIKRWEKDKPPESLTKLTVKEQKYVLARVGGKNKMQAAMEAFDCDTPESAKSIGSKLGADPDIHRAITALMHESGIGRKARIKRLAEVVNAQDLGIAAKGLDLSWKLDGSYAPIQVDYTVTYDPDAQHARYLELKELLAEAIAAKIANETDVIDAVNND